MHVLGRWNWWAPKPLVWLHERLGINDGAAGQPAPAGKPVGSAELAAQRKKQPGAASVTRDGPAGFPG
jgi:RND superfamily putative drug exporter